MSEANENTERHPFTRGWLAYLNARTYRVAILNPYPADTEAAAAWAAGYGEHARMSEPRP